MVIELLFNKIIIFLLFPFSLLPNLPKMPESIVNGIDSFFDIIFDNLGLLNMFIPLSTIKVVVPLAIIIANFKHIYSTILWCIHKLPWSID